MDRSQRSPPILCGMLAKESPARFSLRSNIQRFVILQDGIMYWSASAAFIPVGPEGPPGCKGLVDFRENPGCEVAEVPHSRTKFVLRPSSGRWSKGDFTGAESGRIFSFETSAATRSREDWLAAFRDHIAYGEAAKARERFFEEHRPSMIQVGRGSLISELANEEGTSKLQAKGCTVEQLLKFYIKYGKTGHIKEGTTTKEVVRNIIIPETMRPPRCYMQSDFMMASGGGRPAKKLVSHAWKSEFVNTVIHIMADATGRPITDFKRHAPWQRGKRERVLKNGFLKAEFLLEVVPSEVLTKTYWIDIFAVDEHHAICGDCWKCNKTTAWTANIAAHLRADPCRICKNAKFIPCSCGSVKFKPGDPDSEIDLFEDVVSRMDALVVSLDAPRVAGELGIDDPPSDCETVGDGADGGEASSSGSDRELYEPPKTFVRPRSNAMSAEAYGPSNPRKAFPPIVNQKSPAQEFRLREALKQAKFFQELEEDDLNVIVDAVSIVSTSVGEVIFRQGDPGHDVFVVLSGEVDLYRMGRDSSFPQSGESTLYGQFLRSLEVGAVFGELALLWNTPRSLTVRANETSPPILGRLDREMFSKCIVHLQILKKERKQENLRNVKLLEMMSAEQIAKLAETLELRTFAKEDELIRQGETGRDFFILVAGECVATVKTYFLGIPVDEQEHRRYRAGDLFGEVACLRDGQRTATIKAVSDRVVALRMSRSKFERLLGPLSQLQEDQYLTDPRKLIADFYHSGDANGPAGSLQQHPNEVKKSSLGAAKSAPFAWNLPWANSTAAPGCEVSSWFSVYRPTSRDAIAKMLSGAAVGKGLNVKGKSAKKGVLSGFVPFLQISDNAHKDRIEASPSDSRISLYFRTAQSRESALEALRRILCEAANRLDIDDNRIQKLDSYSPDVFGLDVPEPLLTEAYITIPDIVPRVGWETGRASEPAFMDMNLHAIRGYSDPQVVLYQFDEGDPMNPRGVLIAYAEQFVKPVVSDFDTFTVGSRGVKYEPLPANQVQLALWSLEKAVGVLEEPGDTSWTSRWLGILQEEAEKGFHPEFPKYGFGDPTSYRLISDVVKATISCGAVRHGAECFNFYFPQELDTEYLVIWEGFPDKPWDYKDEAQLRMFLNERVEEGFVFPINPCWAVRDKGWYSVYQKLRDSTAGREALNAWDPPGAGIRKQIEAIHKKFPSGFVAEGQEALANRSGRTRSTTDMFGHDVMGSEKADLASLHVKNTRKKLASAFQQVRSRAKTAAMMKPSPRTAQSHMAISPDSEEKESSSLEL